MPAQDRPLEGDPMAPNEAIPGGEASLDADGRRVCPHCGQAVPPLPFCVRCGRGFDRIHARHEYAAHPGESARALSLFSTLFPHLRPAGYDSFRHAFWLGLLVVAGLVVSGFYPVALVVSALFVPILFALYFIDVDLYERAPLAGIAATLAWGILAGAVIGVIDRAVSGSGSADSGADPTISVLATVGLALLGAGLAALGPLSLIRHRAFNDVLDGATFGAIAGAAYAATSGLVRAGSLITAGLRPGGDPLPWLVRLLTLGVVEPILLAAVLGAVCGAFWLRYRSPVRDRNALGRLGRPGLAVLAGLVLIGLTAWARAILDVVGGLVIATVVAAFSLVWLRATIQVGLMEEANEAEIGPPMRCPNCGRMTPGHTFCGWCGISLQALPRSVPTTSVEADPAEAAG
jgi:hypothetical protein